MKSAFETYPPVLNAREISQALGISIAGAYNLLHQKDFPTLHIGKRMVVPRDKFILWVDQNTGGDRLEA